MCLSPSTIWPCSLIVADMVLADNSSREGGWGRASAMPTAFRNREISAARSLNYSCSKIGGNASKLLNKLPKKKGRDLNDPTSSRG